MSEEIWFFVHLIVPLIWLSKVLTFGKPQINLVFLSLNRTFVPLSKVLTFGKPQINLVFLSLNRTFVPKIREP